MSKQSIKWHQDRLNDMRVTSEQYRAEVKAAQARLNRILLDCWKLDTLICEAVRNGLDGFDADQINKKHDSHERQ